MSASQTFAHALGHMEGVGRVTAGRLLSHFGSYDVLLRFPREQVLARVRGVPNGEDLVARLFDRPAMQRRLTEAASALEQLHRQRIRVLTLQDDAWPGGLRDLPRALRPFLLYTYGSLDVLHQPIVAFFAQPPLSAPAFEQAQALVRHVLPHGVVPATGISHGFDVALQKVANSAPDPRAALLVVHCGLARLPPPLRPAASAAVRAGGLLVSPFPMPHGPFSHDDKERTLLQAALARACVFVEPRAETPAWKALEWVLETGRPVFGLPAEAGSLPERVHPLRDATDMDWVLAAARQER